MEWRTTKGHIAHAQTNKLHVTLETADGTDKKVLVKNYNACKRPVLRFRLSVMFLANVKRGPSNALVYLR